MLPGSAICCCTLPARLTEHWCCRQWIRRSGRCGRRVRHGSLPPSLQASNLYRSSQIFRNLSSKRSFSRCAVVMYAIRFCILVLCWCAWGDHTLSNMALAVRLHCATQGCIVNDAFMVAAMTELGLAPYVVAPAALFCAVPTSQCRLCDACRGE